MSGSTAKKRRNRKVEYTERVLGEALTELVREKPLRSVTVKEIVERADVNRSTFYVHFEGMEDLVRHVERSAAEAVIGYIKNAESRGEGAGDILDGLFDFVDANRDVLFWLVDDNVTGEALELVRDYCRRACVERWIDLTGLSEKECNCAITYIFGGGTALLRDWYRGGFRDTNTIRRCYRDLKVSTLAGFGLA